MDTAKRLQDVIIPNLQMQCDYPSQGRADLKEIADRIHVITTRNSINKLSRDDVHRGNLGWNLQPSDSCTIIEDEDFHHSNFLAPDNEAARQIRYQEEIVKTILKELHYAQVLDKVWAVNNSALTARGLGEQSIQLLYREIDAAFIEFYSLAETNAARLDAADAAQRKYDAYCT